MVSTLNRAFLHIQRRAEQSDPLILAETFVDIGPMFTMLSSVDHQIIYGRRGTGKTHILTALADQVRRRGNLPIFLDMRTIGSTGGIYADESISIAERGTRLLLDTLGVMHEALVDYVLQCSDSMPDFDPTQSFALLDRLATEIGQSVRVVGSVQVSTTVDAEQTGTESTGAGVSVSAVPALNLRTGSTRQQSLRVGENVQRAGIEQHRVHFGAVSQLLRRLVESIPADRIWLLMDEWSSVPLDLQPLLADLVRRSIFPVAGITVKIGAIERRANFRVLLPGGDHLGIEVGADAPADVDLDDFMVFGSNAELAKEFFRALLFKHVSAVLSAEDDDPEIPDSPAALVAKAFTQRTAFDEFVRSAEGVPRDAINILALAAQRANDDVISVQILRSAALAWYQRDKESAINANEDARDLLVWINNEVLQNRQARAFMLKQGDDSHPLIRTLYDARVLHLIRRGIAARDQPGVRFNGWSLDYGCYVDLVNTTKAPLGLWQVEEDDEGEPEFTEVPVDDYRSIRRAILDLDRYEQERGYAAN